MKRDPRDLVRYSGSERANHWVVGMCFILLALSGLAFFHPAFFPLTMLFGGGTWARILHPFIGVIMTAFFVVMAMRFWKLNVMSPTDWEWLRRIRELIDGDDHNMPEMGKYNGGQKLLFWLFVGCVFLLFVSGIVIWRAYFAGFFPIGDSPVLVCACRGGGDDDCSDNGPYLCRDLGQGNDPGHVVRHGYSGLGQAAPSGLVQNGCEVTGRSSSTGATNSGISS